MKEHPILFTGEMVRVVQEGRKTQTRRVIRLPPGFHPPCKDDSGADLMTMFKCPYGVPGDRLWVRETFAWSGYACDQEEVLWRADQEYTLEERNSSPWKPSIHMPRWASRITLEVTHVRVQRVQSISNKDCAKEGIRLMRLATNNPFEAGIQNIKLGGEVTGYRTEFKILWNSINEKRGYGWDNNPWVWVIEFKEVKP